MTTDVQEREVPVKGAAKKETREVFLRNSSGVVRAMSTRDGMFFGYLSGTGLYGVALFFFMGLGTFPGASVTLALIINLVIFAAVYGAYSMLGSAMPRSGGDYVFQSRIISPAFGFVATFSGLCFWQFFYAFLAANVLVTACLVPFCQGIGAITGGHGWITVANWLAGTHVTLAFAIFFLLLAGVIMSRGMRVYLLIQRWFMIGLTAIAIAIIGIQWLVVPHSTFLHNFNKFERAIGALSASNVISKAAQLGYTPHAFSWGSTLALTALLGSGTYLWCMWQTELLGEMKSAGNLRRVFTSMWGGAVLITVTFLIALTMTYHYVGWHLMGPFIFLAFKHPDALGGGWAVRGAPSFFMIPTLNVIVAIVIFLGFFGPISQSMFNTTMAVSRLLLAQSFDRVLPSWVGQVNRRGVPGNAVWGGTAVAIVLAILFSIQPTLSQTLVAGYVFGFLGLIGTPIAAILFPYRMRATYAASPAARYKVFGLPAVSIVGVLALAVFVFINVELLSQPATGVLTRAALWSWITFFVVTAAAIIYYFVRAAVLKKSGTDLRHAFRDVPPE